MLDAAQFTPSQLAHAICGLEVNSSGNVARTFDQDPHSASRTVTTSLLVRSRCLTLYGPVLEEWPPAEAAICRVCDLDSDRLPPSGSEVITIQMAYAGIGERAKLTLGMLPQAHTCDLTRAAKPL